MIKKNVVITFIVALVIYSAMATWVMWGIKIDAVDKFMCCFLGSLCVGFPTAVSHSNNS